MSESQDFLLTARNLKITIYLSLTIANVIFGVLHPESILVAGCGFVFFGALTLSNLRTDEQEKDDSDKKLVRIDK